jgi:hypothetical protein
VWEVAKRLYHWEHDCVVHVTLPQHKAISQSIRKLWQSMERRLWQYVEQQSRSSPLAPV